MAVLLGSAIFAKVTILLHLVGFLTFISPILYARKQSRSMSSIVASTGVSKLERYVRSEKP